MKKLIAFILSATIFCSITACGNHFSSNDDSDSNDDLISPGEDRLWWDANFDNIDEAKDFIIKLKNAQKNGDFNFGVCDFVAPSGYEIFSITFSGHIDNNASKKEDIYNSSYDYFEIQISCYKNREILPAYNRFHIYFYPFCLADLNFVNSKIEHNVYDYYDGSCEISFSYDKNVLMEVNLLAESNHQIDKENLIDELSNSYKLVV